MIEQAERRSLERFEVNRDAACPLLSPVVENFGSVKVRDVSMQGVGLLVGRRIEPGALLAVVLENRARGFSKTVLVRVTHVAAQPGGGFVVGGAFTAPLSYKEMSALVL
jgi:hypothetical protein